MKKLALALITAVSVFGCCVHMARSRLRRVLLELKINSISETEMLFF